MVAGNVTVAGASAILKKHGSVLKSCDLGLSAPAYAGRFHIEIGAWSLVGGTGGAGVEPSSASK